MVITLTTQQRLMAPRVAASPTIGAAKLLTEEHELSRLQLRKTKRGAAASLLSFRRNIGKEGMSHQLIWEPHGPLPVCVYVFGQEKKPDRGRNTDDG